MKKSKTRMIGESAVFRRLLALVDRVAEKPVTVLITGETGTGKELVARRLHDVSERSSRAFVAVNCGAIPSSLLEAELFGHAAGAFTGAHQARAGKFEQADRGTIFLDEIGDMPIKLQARLLRVLEERQVERLGSNRLIPLDVRVVAATHSELKEQMERGHFRSDLFYRLNVVPIQLPPLRERSSDIPLLAEFFLNQIRAERELGPKTFSAQLMEWFIDYDWPGNVRELRNAVEFAVTMAENDRVLGLDHLPVDLYSATGLPRELMDELTFSPDGVDLNQILHDLQVHLIEQSLKRTGGNKQQAAELLSLTRSALQSRLRSLKLDR